MIRWFIFRFVFIWILISDEVFHVYFDDAFHHRTKLYRIKAYYIWQQQSHVAIFLLFLDKTYWLFMESVGLNFAVSSKNGFASFCLYSSCFSTSKQSSGLDWFVCKERPVPKSRVAHSTETANILHMLPCSVGD